MTHGGAGRAAPGAGAAYCSPQGPWPWQLAGWLKAVCDIASHARDNKASHCRNGLYGLCLQHKAGHSR